MLKKITRRVADLTLGQIIWGACSIGIIWTWAIYGLALLESPAIAEGEGEGEPEQAELAPEQDTGQPKILKFQLTLTEPADLKVQRGDQVKAGDVLSDRTRIREQLLGQKARLQIAIEGIQSQKILDPPAPLPAPPMVELPPANFEAEERAIEAASRKVDLQERKVDAIAIMQGRAVPTAVIQHEQVQLETLRQQLDQAEAALQRAETERAQLEYENSISAARRVEESNQSRLSYSFQLQQREQQRRDKEFQLAQLGEKLQEVERELSDLSAVIAPYDGVVRRVKWLGQNDNALQVEVTIATDRGSATDPFGNSADGLDNGTGDGPGR